MPTKTSLNQKKKSLSSYTVPSLELDVKDIIEIDVESNNEGEEEKNEKSFIELLLNAKPEGAPEQTINEVTETITRSRLMRLNIEFLEEYNGIKQLLDTATAIMDNNEASNIRYIGSIIGFVHSKGIHTSYEPGAQREDLVQIIVDITIALIKNSNNVIKNEV